MGGTIERRAFAITAIVAVVAAGGLAPAAASGKSTATSTSPTGTASTATSIPASRVAAEAVWGISNGKTYVKILKGTQVAQPNFSAAANRSTVAGSRTAGPAVASATTACHDYISDVTLGAGVFHWQTEETCIGSYGWHKINTQLWRSSWSGPRGYGSWAQSRESVDEYINEYWGINCNAGHGYYDYYPVMRGYASGIGSGPTLRSNNQLNQKNCGTGPP